MVTIQDLLTQTIDRKASDLHIVSDYYPYLRINNELYTLQIYNVLPAKDVEALFMSILNDEQKENLLANKEIDFGYNYNGHRFRVNMYNAKNSLAAAFRLIPSVIPSIEDLGLPASFHSFAKLRQGLVLFTGPTGEGKSTSLASIINEINVTSARHIITIEDPVEYIYPAGKSVFSQRELHQDTFSWQVALRSVLREDPDVVLVGEMRDYETIQAVLTIAETGHLVFSTLHTGSSADAINRIIDVFPPAQQNQIRSQLSGVLTAVVTQRLVPNIDNTSRLPIIEALYNIPAVSAIIREGKTFMLDNILMTEEREDMVLFEKDLMKAYQQGKITKETAFNFAIRPTQIRKLLQ